MPEITVPAEAYVLGGLFVHVVHQETGGEWDCPTEHLPTALGEGWVPTAPNTEDVITVVPSGPVEDPEPQDDDLSFDPNDHGVTAVNNYLAQHAEGAPGEVARVLELEANGQARKGITNGPHGTPAED